MVGGGGLEGFALSISFSGRLSYSLLSVECTVLRKVTVSLIYT